MSTLAATHLADGPAMYFGGTIESFALPLGALIVIATVLFFVFRSSHPGLKLKYLTSPGIASLGTREPGPAPAPPVAAVEVAKSEAEQDTTAEPEATAKPESEAEPESEK
jgi:hypothetical protein